MTRQHTKESEWSQAEMLPDLGEKHKAAKELNKNEKRS